MKKISIFSLAILSIIILSGCGGGGSSPTGSSYYDTGDGEGSGNNSGGNNNGGNNNDGTDVMNISVTVSGGKYVINGVTTGSLSLEKGMTYTFTNSSNSAHPFRLSQTMDGTHSGGTIYSLGVTYSGNILTFVVPSTAPATLYYYCTVHAAMGGSGSISISGASGSTYWLECQKAKPMNTYWKGSLPHANSFEIPIASPSETARYIFAGKTVIIT